MFDKIPEAKKILVGLDGIAKLISDHYMLEEKWTKQAIEESNVIMLQIKHLKDDTGNTKQELIKRIEKSNFNFKNLSAKPIEDEFIIDEFNNPIEIFLPTAVYVIFDTTEWLISLYESLRELKAKEKKIIEDLIALITTAIDKNFKSILNSNKRHIKTSIIALNTYLQDAYKMTYESDLFSPSTPYNPKLLLSFDEYMLQVLGKTRHECNYHKMKDYLTTIELYEFISDTYGENSRKVIEILCRDHYIDDSITVTLETKPRFYTYTVLIGLTSKLMEMNDNDSVEVGKVLCDLYHFFEEDKRILASPKNDWSRYLKELSGKNAPMKNKTHKTITDRLDKIGLHNYLKLTMKNGVYANPF